MQANGETLQKLCATRKRSLYSRRLKTCMASINLVDCGFNLCMRSCSKREFNQCVGDTCLYWKVDVNDTVVVDVYVDYLLATCTSEAAVDRFFTSLASLLIKDLGRVSKFLGIGVTLDDDGGYTLDQEEAIGDLIREHWITDANSTLAPIGFDCYEVQTTDIALLKVTSTNVPQSIKDFTNLLDHCCG